MSTAASLGELFQRYRTRLCLDIKTCSLLLDVSTQELYAVDRGRYMLDACYVYKLSLLGFPVDKLLRPGTYCILTREEFPLYSFIAQLSFEEKQAWFAAISMYLSVLQLDGLNPNRELLLNDYKLWDHRKLSRHGHQA